LEIKSIHLENMMKTAKNLAGLAALLLVSGIAQAGDTSALARVSPVQDADYQYRQYNNGAAAEARRVEIDKLNRAVAVLESNLGADLKRVALEELIPINHPLATRTLGNMLKQAEASGNAEAQRVVATAVWYHAAQLGFNDKAANALSAGMRSSKSATVRAIGGYAVADSAGFKRRNQ
jgi:hypothetical protein